MKKKADVNWVVVSMVIAVIVLAITAYLFWKYSTQSATQATGIAGCEARKGQCRTEPCLDNEISLGRYSCDPKKYNNNENVICCVPVGSSPPS